MKRTYLAGGIAVALLAAGVGCYTLRSRGAAPAPEAAAEDSTVLVQTMTVREQAFSNDLDAFGEIGTAKPESLSFPQAGQLARLAVVAGQRVRRGEVIASLASDPVAVSAYAQARSGVSFAERELRRNEELFGLKLATQSQLDTARKQLSDARDTLAAQAKLGGATPTAQLIAPFDGVVTALPVGLGDRLSAGATVLQLGASNRPRVLLAIDPASSAQIKPGMHVSVTALQGGAPMECTVAEVEGAVDPKTGMVTALVDLPAKQAGPLVSGTRVEAAIHLDRRSAWAVPRQAVLSDDKGTYVFQVVTGKARRVNVSRLAESGATYGVSGSIDGRWPVVVLGNYELKDGMAVREGGQ